MCRLSLKRHSAIFSQDKRRSTASYPQLGAPAHLDGSLGTLDSIEFTLESSPLKARSQLLIRLRLLLFLRPLLRFGMARGRTHSRATGNRSKFQIVGYLIGVDHILGSCEDVSTRSGCVHLKMADSTKVFQIIGEPWYTRPYRRVNRAFSDPTAPKRSPFPRAKP